MSEEKKADDIVVLTPAFRVSFPNVFKPRAAFDNQEPTYNIQMLFPMDPKNYPEKLRKALPQACVDLSNVKKALAAAATKEWGSKEKWPTFKHPVIRKGEDKSDLDQYKGMFFINAKSQFKPGIVNQANEDIITPEEFYAGCWARATLRAYTYDNKFGAGVNLGLQNLQFLMDDAAFSGKRNAKDDFEAIEGFSDDAFAGSDSGGGEFGESAAESYDF